MAENTIIEDMCDMRFKDVLGTAVKMFIEGINGATSITQSGGGGGSNSELPWRDKDEDIFSFARRCMRFAHSKHYPKKSSGLRGNVSEYSLPDINIRGKGMYIFKRSHRKYATVFSLILFLASA